MAPVLKKAGFLPIIEPVRDAFGGLNRALDAIMEVNGRAIVIVNPRHGELANSSAKLSEALKSEYFDTGCIWAGVLLKQGISIPEIIRTCRNHENYATVLIHAGFGEAKKLAEELGKEAEPAEQFHVFIEKDCGKLYRKHFSGSKRVLLRDGFERKRNRDYDLLEPFSDLHVTFEDEGMDGFGDFLIVGDDYIESGGPAYAVAIHLTFIDPDQDDSMWIYHFVSERQDTPTDPAGKFAEALAKMMKVLNKPNSKILETSAVREFKELHRQRHFPGLGYVKKLSMNHHIETLADYFQKTE